MITTTPSPIDSEDLSTRRTRPSPRRRRGRRLFTIVLSILGGIALALFALQSVRPHLYSGTVLQGATPAPTMDGLVFGDGSSVELAAFEGDLLMVYFGYANCPDICPTTLVKAAEAIDRLDPDLGARARLLMVSVDPERDTPAILSEYTRFFHPSFVGATGPTTEVDNVASQYGIFYQLGEGENYTVDHTSSLMGIGPDGVLRILWPPDVSAERLSDDIAELLG